MIPIVILRGTPFERGRQHGDACLAAIRTMIRDMKADHDKEYATARSRAERSWANLEKAAPDITQELEGIAEGSGCEPIDIYLHSGFEFFLKVPPTGCSALAVAGEKGAIVAQNWDGPARFRRDLIVFVHVGPDGFEQALVATAGMLGWVGCNSHGLAFVNNDLMLDHSIDGLPSQAIRRMILAQPHVGLAMHTLRQCPHMSGRCYLMGDASGAIGGVEVSPTASAVPLEGPRLAHTNHALLSATQAVEDRAALQGTYPSSRQRLEALRGYGLDTMRTIERVGVALKDRSNAPDAVAKSVSSGEPTQTIFSVIFDCSTLSMHLCDGPPSENEFETIDLRSFGLDRPASACESSELGVR